MSEPTTNAEGAMTGTLAQAVSGCSALPVAVLRRFPKRLRDMIEAERIETVGQLAAWADRDEGRRPKFGPGTRKLLADRLLAFARHAVSPGTCSPSAPESAGALLAAWITSVADDDVRWIVGQRYRERRTLDEIGRMRQRPVTRERVRQILEGELSTARPLWEDAARRVFAPVLSLLEAGAGLAPLETCLNLGGAGHAGELRAAANLAGIDLHIDESAGLASLLPLGKMHEFQADLRDDVGRVLEDGCSIDPIRAVLLENGIGLPEEEERKLLWLLLGIEVRDGAVFGGRRRVQAAYLAELRAAGGPISLAELASRIDKSRPDLGANLRNAMAHVQRSRDALGVGRGLWTHVDNLGLPRERLDEIVEACETLVPRTGAEVNVRQLLRRVAETSPVPDGLEARTVRDALLRRGNLHARRTGLSIAWRAGNPRFVNVAEWISEWAPQLDQPFRPRSLRPGSPRRRETWMHPSRRSSSKATRCSRWGAGSSLLAPCSFATMPHSSARAKTCCAAFPRTTSSRLAGLATPVCCLSQTAATAGRASRARTGQRCFGAWHGACPA